MNDQMIEDINHLGAIHNLSVEMSHNPTLVKGAYTISRAGIMHAFEFYRDKIIKEYCKLKDVQAPEEASKKNLFLIKILGDCNVQFNKQSETDQVSASSSC